MTHVARILPNDEVTGDRCVVCGAPGEVFLGLVTPAGVVDPRERQVASARTCRRCAQAQADAARIGARFVYPLVAVAPVIGVASGWIAGREDGLAATAGVVVGLVVTQLGFRAIERARARATPVLLLEADRERVVLQLAVPNAPRSAGAAAYRGAGTRELPSDARADEPVAPLPPRTSFGLPRFGGLLATVAVVFMAWNGLFDQRATLVVDSPSSAVRVRIDDESFELAAGGRATRTVRAGRHTFEIAYADDDVVVRESFEVRAARGVLITTDPAQCYRVWTVWTLGDTRQSGPVRWNANLADARQAERTECDRLSPR